MKNSIDRLGRFYRNLRVCMGDAYRDTDTWYHIPKSRFNGGPEERKQLEYLSESVKRPATNAFMGSFRDCLLSAWKASDRDYHIPKSQFQDQEFNNTAYRAEVESGPLGRVGKFLSSLSGCLKASWEASDTFYHLPKSRYQEPRFIRELMDLAPQANGKLKYRPYMIGRGFVFGEASGKGWYVEPPEELFKDILYVPEMEAGPGGKQDLKI